MRDAIEELLARVRRLAQTLAGAGENEERGEELREAVDSGARRRNGAARGPVDRLAWESREWEEDAFSRRARQEAQSGWRMRTEQRAEVVWEGGADAALTRQENSRVMTDAVREETEAVGTGGGDAREYGFGDGTDPSRYFYSEDYLERLSGYLETDARRYGPRNMG